ESFGTTHAHSPPMPGGFAPGLAGNPTTFTTSDVLSTLHFGAASATPPKTGIASDAAPMRTARENQRVRMVRRATPRRPRDKRAVPGGRVSAEQLRDPLDALDEVVVPQRERQSGVPRGAECLARHDRDLRRFEEELGELS